ncbi:MAG: SurA N-terminal domain-containing protein [Pseudohongiellaceae bacterium]|nr:SurA N-terminal domain-containing protein [Pseudohongiellaceae bacterium]
MLQNIRDNSQGWVAKIIIGFIIALFALLGVESIIGGFAANPAVATVNGDKITQPQLDAGIQNLMASIGGDLGSLDEGLVQQIALSQIIEERLLQQSASDLNMQISNRAVDRAIINTPGFQVGGSYNDDIARRTMATQGFTPETYKAALARQMVVEQLANAYISSSFVTDQELDRIASLSSQTRDFQFLSVTLGNRTAGEAIPAEQIEAYYENNQDQFMLDEEVLINYVVLDKAAIAQTIEVSEEDIVEQYELEASNANTSSQRRASHILLELNGDRDEAQAVAEAQALKERLDAGEEFAAIALEASSDTISAQEGGDIGYSDGSAFPAELEEALEELEVGQVSEPVVSEFGVHLVKLTEFEANEFPTLEEERERIRMDLASVEVDEIYFGQLETLANLAFETDDLSAINEELGLEIIESESFTRMGGSTEITRNPNVIAAAFSDEVLQEGLNSEVIEAGERAIVVHLNEFTEASIRPLAEVRGEIAAILRTEIEKERALALGEQILAALEAGESVDELVAENELQWIVQRGASRDQAGLNGQVLEHAFSMPAPSEDSSVYDGLQLNNGTYVVIELQSIEKGSLEKLSESERDAMVANYVQTDGRDTFNKYLQSLQESAEITQTLDISDEI